MIVEGYEVTTFKTVEVTSVPQFEYANGKAYNIRRVDFYYCGKFELEGFHFLVGSLKKQNWKHPDRVLCMEVGVGVKLGDKYNLDIAVNLFKKRYATYKNVNKNNSIATATAPYLRALYGNIDTTILISIL